MRLCIEDFSAQASMFDNDRQLISRSFLLLGEGGGETPVGKADIGIQGFVPSCHTNHQFLSYYIAAVCGLLRNIIFPCIAAFDRCDIAQGQ